MKPANECFALRFNLHKSGCDFEDSIELFSEIFGENKEKISSCISEYDKINIEAAQKILAKKDMADIERILVGKTIVLFGDSITSERLSYGKIIERILPCTVIDCAVSCSRSVDVLNKLDATMEKYNPDIVSVMIGTNDVVCLDTNTKNPSVSLTEFGRNIDLIAQKVKIYGKELVFHSIPFGFYEVFNKKEKFKSASKENCLEYNMAIKFVSKKYGALFNDMSEMFELYSGQELFEPDGIHLSWFAHMLWAEEFIKILQNIDKNIK